MREAAKKISTKEFIHLNVQTLLKKTDTNSLVERYFYMLYKDEFKFLERGWGREETFEREHLIESGMGSWECKVSIHWYYMRRFD